MNVHIYAYDDLSLVERAVASVRDTLGDVPIHVLDGRYALFDGETDLTPGLVGWCTGEGVIYHAPMRSRLPFGHDTDALPEYRPGVHAKAMWAFEHALPPDEWTLKMDADETLKRFDADLENLSAEGKYAPVIHRHGDTAGTSHITRLFKPTHWTPWINDTLLPRPLFPRDSALETLAAPYLQKEFRVVWHINRGHVRDVEIDNHGADRPADYQHRRVAHLEAIGRDRRAEDVRVGLDG